MQLSLFIKMSKLLSIFLIILLAASAIGNIMLYGRIHKLESEVKPVTANADTQAPAIIDEKPKQNIEDDYLKSRLRVVGVFKSSGTTDENMVSKVNLVVATDRVEKAGDANDEQCGSRYSQPICYFFVEPRYIAGAPNANFIGKIESEGAFMPNTVKFGKNNTVDFQTADGDAGYSRTVNWQLNLETGEFKKVSIKETNSN